MASRPTGPIQTQTLIQGVPAPLAVLPVQAVVALPTLRILASATSKPEGNSGTTLFSFTVTRSSGIGASSASWSVVHGTTNGADFSGGPTSGTVSFAAGETSKTILISVAGDTLVEANETFSVVLSAPSNATLTTASATATILNDDKPRLSIVANTPNVDEGTSAGGTTPVTFTVTRDTSVGTSAVAWSVVHRGTNASDFSGATSGNLSFVAGETTKTITVNVVADALIEANESFDVVLSSPVGATISTATASTSVINDDLHTLGITATTASRNEGNTGTTPFTFTVTRSAGVGTSTVDWAVVHGTTNAADFSGATSGSVTFASGQTSKIITVYALGDTVFENNEAFSVQLVNPGNARIVNGSAGATIVNDDAAPIPVLSIVATDASKTEGSTGATAFTFTITRTHGVGTSTANWSVVHGTTDAADFSGSTTGTVSFAAGETSKLVTVNVAGDTTVEAAETFSVQLSGPTGATLGTTSATATILNDDRPSITITSADDSRLEGNSGSTTFSYTVTRSSGVGISSVDYSVNTPGGESPVFASADDFEGPLAGTLTFNEGETSKVISIKIKGDTAAEDNEHFQLYISNPVNGVLPQSLGGLINSMRGYTNPDGTHVWTEIGTDREILNDDLPSLSIAASQASQNEGSTGTTAFTFTVTRNASIGTSSAAWAIVHGSTSAADFSGATSGTVSFASGETSKTITVNVVGDTTVETAETFSVQLASPTGATLGTASATSTILNDDLAKVTLTSGTQSAYEGNSGATPFSYTVTRDSGIGTASVNFAVSGGSAQPDDFSGSTSGQVTFSEGETSKVVTLNVAGDTVVEADESFVFVLTNPSNLTLNSEFNGTMNTRSGYYAPDGSVVYTTIGMSSLILNDDTAVVVPTVSIVATDASKAEGNSGTTAFTFTVTRSSGTGTSSVAYQINTPMASVDDFASGTMSGTVSFAAGETAKTITVNVLGDTTVESDETFYVQLFSPVNATLGTATASSTILNDDLPSLSIAASQASQNEGSTGTTAFTFTVTRNASIGTSSAAWAIVHGTTSATDFSGATSGTVSFAAGETSKTITVNVVGDTTVEAAETFSVQLSSPSGATLGTASATATIVNDDLPALNIAATTATLSEGNSGSTTFSFTVTRTSDIGLSSATWAIEHGTTDAADFTGATSGTVSFAAGETSKTITVSVIGDTLVEGDEAFSVKLSGPSGATLGTASATGTILNDDAAVTPTLSITTADTSKAEGNAGTTPFTFTVTRSAGTGTSSVNWMLAGGSTNATDFAAGTPFGVNSTLTFAAGETSKTITVNVAGDTTLESDETFSVQLSSPTNGLLGTSTATATILDDDTPVISIAATDADKLEGTGTNPVMTFTISRSLGTGTSSVFYTVVAGTAVAGSDYYGTTANTVTFASGETSKTITVNISGDSTIEPDENFQVVLSSPSGGRIGVGTATATIRNDDRAGIDGSSALVTNIVVPTAVDDSIENLVETTKWGGAIGTGAQLTYSFSTANSVFTYASGSEVPYASLNAAQKAAAVMAMNAITAICGVTFTEVPDTATSAGDIRWTQSLNGALSTAHAYYPSSWAGGGDVWIGPDASYTSPVVGGYSYQTFIHELGHSMGLNHPHQGTPAPEPNEDQLKYSVMSYRDNPNASTTTGYSSNYYPTDYMLNDVLALQYLYGVNTTSNQGDTVYQWDAASKVYDCIWDVGGNDTIDASNQVVACTVNLNGGTWSTIGATYYNGAGQVNNSLSIAYEVTGVAGVSNVIENAVGSAQADTLIGNAVGNRLTGGAGADTLTGGGGADTFFYFSIAQGGDTVTDFVSGTDKIEVYSANFANLAVGTLAASRFVSGAAPAALDGNAVFLYNSSNGQLTFDSNGTSAGGTTLIATLSGAATLGAGDIRIVATTS